MPKSLQIKITLNGLKPPVWRRVLVKDSITLDELHQIIQYSMGWKNCHLYSFEFNDTTFMHQDEFNVMDCKDPGIKLSSLKLKEKDKINYIYDFGDSWGHQILIEKISPIGKTQLYPFCIKGVRACPPEDSGGIWGYQDKIAAISNKSHPEHDEIVDWMGDDFDPEYVNMAQINRDLQMFLQPA